MPGTTGTAVLQAQLAMNDHYQQTLAQQLQANAQANQMRVRANQDMWNTINQSIRHMSDIAVERQMIQKRAELQAIRDKQLNEYELGQIREYGIREQALDTFRRTGGISEGEIAKEAALRPGVSIDVVRQEKIAAEEKRKFDLSLQQKDQELRQIDKTKLSLADAHKMEAIAKIDLGITQIESSDFRPEVKRSMIAEAKATRQELMMGIELPPTMSIQQQVEANTFVDANGTPWTVDKKTGAVMVPRGYKPPDAGMTGTPKSLPADTRESATDKDPLYVAILNQILQKRPKLTNTDGTPGLRIRTIEEAYPEEIEEAQTKMQLRKERLFHIQQRAAWYMANIPELSAATARQYAEEDYEKGNIRAKGKAAAQQTKEETITGEFKGTHGIPITQPAPEQPVTRQFEDEATGKMVTFALRNGQWVRQ